MARPFKQRRYFFYVTGVVEPDCHVTYDIAEDKLTLYVPDFDFKRTIWTGPTLGKDEASQRCVYRALHEPPTGILTRMQV